MSEPGSPPVPDLPELPPSSAIGWFASLNNHEFSRASVDVQKRNNDEFSRASADVQKPARPPRSMVPTNRLGQPPPQHAPPQPTHKTSSDRLTPPLRAPLPQSTHETSSGRLTPPLRAPPPQPTPNPATMMESKIEVSDEDLPPPLPSTPPSSRSSYAPTDEYSPGQVSREELRDPFFSNVHEFEPAHASNSLMASALIRRVPTSRVLSRGFGNSRSRLNSLGAPLASKTSSSSQIQIMPHSGKKPDLPPPPLPDHLPHHHNLPPSTATIMADRALRATAWRTRFNQEQKDEGEKFRASEEYVASKVRFDPTIAVCFDETELGNTSRDDIKLFANPLMSPARRLKPLGASNLKHFDPTLNAIKPYLLDGQLQQLVMSFGTEEVSVLVMQRHAKSLCSVHVNPATAVFTLKSKSKLSVRRRTENLTKLKGVYYGPFMSDNFDNYLLEGGLPWLCVSLEFVKMKGRKRRDYAYDLLFPTSELCQSFFTTVQALAPLSAINLSPGNTMWQRLIMKLNYYGLYVAAGLASVPPFLSPVPRANLRTRSKFPSR